MTAVRRPVPRTRGAARHSLTVKKSQRGPIVLAILDGWGIAPPGPGNAITRAHTPVMDRLWRTAPHALLAASGTVVGLPDNQEGNSEAGHLNIGAGRVVLQESVRINRSIRNGLFAKNPAFSAAFHHVRKHRSRLHLMGILTDGPSTHADPFHLYALLDLAHRACVPEVYMHLFTDGRDSPQFIAPILLRRLQRHRYPEQHIASIAGRYYLDRKKRWGTTEQIYHALVVGSQRRAASATEAVTRAYNQRLNDEFVPPTVIALSNRAAGRSRIQDGDSVIFFNFRSDRARQLTKAFVQPQFNARNPGSFRRQKVLRDLLFIAMTDFGPDLGDLLTAYPSEDLADTLPMQFRDVRQVYVAESEKFAHMTFFFNGGYDRPVAGEERILIPSPNVRSYDRTPEMRARTITDTILRALRKHTAFLALNYANADMVGHTGHLHATIRAVEAVDHEIGRLFTAVRAHRGTLVIVGDHGNAELMRAPKTREVMTEHTTNPVPFVIAAPVPLAIASRGTLANVAPTILQLVGRPIPPGMRARGLIRSRSRRHG